MAINSPPHESAVPFLNGVIEALDLAKEISGIAPAKAVFDSASILLVMIKDSMVHEKDYVKLGLSCADVCQALDQGLEKRRINKLNESMLEAIEKLMITVAAIQKKAVEQGKRNRFSRVFHAKRDKGVIAAWGQDLDRTLNIFNMELSMDSCMTFSNVYRDALAGQKLMGSRHQSTQPSACLEKLHSIALIGAGGIEKTSTALPVLQNCIKDRFGLARCDQFPAPQADLLRQLSKVIATGTKDSDTLSSPRSSLSYKEMLIVLDGVESIPDPNVQEICDAKEPTRFEKICLCATPRTPAGPSNWKCLGASTLLIEATRSTFRRICARDEQSDVIDNVLTQLGFHPLPITLLAAVANQSDWDSDQLAREWGQCQTDGLHTEYSKSLAATIGLSLASTTFKDLGPDAHGLLEVVAFLPQGVNENNLEWLFPTIPDVTTILDRFCTLSLAYRSQGFVTMLAPLRDHLRPKDPIQSLLLRATKELYLGRLSLAVDPFAPGFEDGRWITSEDLNVEHLLDVFTSIDAGSEVIWDGCANFIGHLYWHKRRQTVLSSKIKQLPDNHHSKPQCLLLLSWLFGSVGNLAEQKRLATRALGLHQERGDENGVAEALVSLSSANGLLGLFKEGMGQAEEAFAIQERLGNTAQQANCSHSLAFTLCEEGKLDAAEEVVFRAINLRSEEGRERLLSVSHCILGNIYRAKGERESEIHHFEEALRIASLVNFRIQLFWAHFSLARLFCDRGEFDDAHTHIQQAGIHAANDAYFRGCAAQMHGEILYRQRRFDDAISEALRAIGIFEGLEGVGELPHCRVLLQNIERAAPTRSREARRSLITWIREHAVRHATSIIPCVDRRSTH